MHSSFQVTVVVVVVDVEEAVALTTMVQEVPPTMLVPMAMGDPGEEDHLIKVNKFSAGS